MANTSAFTRKMGPLPVWAWGILGGLAVYFLYVRYKNASGNSAVNSPVATTLDPSAVDPATGLTYGQEMAGSFPSAGGLQGAADSATAPGLDNQLQDFATLVSDFGALAGQLGFTPPQPSDTTVAAAQSDPLDNTQPVATEGITKAQGNQIIKLLQGKKKVPTKNPTAHRAKTIHAANPGNHQHPVHKPKSTAKPVPVKRPAGGGHPGKVPSGSHAKPTTAPSRTGHPVARNPAPPPRRPSPPPPRRPPAPPRHPARRG